MVGCSSGPQAQMNREHISHELKRLNQLASSVLPL